MDEPGSSGLADLAPMRVRADSVRSTVAGFLDQQMAQPSGSGLDTTINGIDTAAHLGIDAAEPQTEYDMALARFMRNEVDYDEFMRLTGGIPLGDESLENDAVVDFDEASQDEEEDEEDEEEEDEDGQPREKLMLVKDETDIPIETRNMVRELVTEELVTVPKPQTASGSGRMVVSRKLNPAMDALLGQANLSYAKGQTKEALSMLLEVIRQEPRNPEPYRQVSEVYRELNSPHRSLHYGLLAAHLDARTPAYDWSHLGDLSTRLQRFEEAAACYGRAIRLDKTNWKHYEKRIAMLDMIGLRPLAMKTRLQAAQSIEHSQANVDFDWFHKLIKTVAEYYISINDEDKAILALEAFVMRSKEFGRSAESQHETLVGMWMTKGKFAEACRSIFALCPGIKAKLPDGTDALAITFSNGFYSVEPYPPPPRATFEIADTFSTFLITRVIVCFISGGQKHFVPELLTELFRRRLDGSLVEEGVLDIARAYSALDAHPATRRFLEQLLNYTNFLNNADMWYLYGKTLMALKEETKCMDAFEKVLQLNPGHVDARINLSGVQQHCGQGERALETLRDHDLDTCTHLPDERLLIRQADVLFDRGRYEQFIRCARMLLTPYFYEIHANPDAVLRKKSNAKGHASWNMSNTLCQAAIAALRNTPLEKFVKRLGAVALAEGRQTDELSTDQLHDYCLRLIERLDALGRYQDMLCVCCYAFMLPKFRRNTGSNNFKSVLYYCAIKAENWPLAFEFVRWYHLGMMGNTAEMPPQHREVLFRRIFNAMNYVFCHSQSVSYHRYVMRALAKSAGNHALQAISGNNSLVTGTYRHALGEYLRVWSDNRNNPLVCLLIGLTFTHMACKKDLSSRHMMALRGLAFLRRYERMRSVRQETNYNLGRVFHQLSITPLAVHFYKKALDEPAPMVVRVDECGVSHVEAAQRYDLRPFAAHNLALIYKTSGNEALARKIYEQYVVV